jgi:AcrR family transcriptional regulator
MTGPTDDPRRRAARIRLTATAMDLFSRQGYEATTVADILAGAEVSKRTFFRYFGSKQELVLGNLEWIGRRLADRLAERPPQEDPWTALRRSYDSIVARIDADPRRAAGILRMLEETPALTAAVLARHTRWRDLLVPLVRARLDPPSETRAVALAGASLACYEVALRRWLRTRGVGEVGGLLDEAMSALAPLAPAAGAPLPATAEGAELTDAQWAAIAPLLPSSAGRRGRAFQDDRRVVEGIVHRFRRDLAWREVPVEFGPWQTLWKRYRRYDADGTWTRMVAALLETEDSPGAAEWAAELTVREPPERTR